MKNQERTDVDRYGSDDILQAEMVEGSGGRFGWGIVIGFVFGLVLGFLLGNITAGIGFGTGFGLMAGVLADAGTDRVKRESERVPTPGRV